METANDRWIVNPLLGTLESWIYHGLPHGGGCVQPEETRVGLEILAGRA